MTVTPDQAAALTDPQKEVLNRQLTTMRHDINNYLSLMMAAVELIRRKPEAVDRMMGTLTEQPLKITAAMKKFTSEFESSLGIHHS